MAIGSSRRQRSLTAALLALLLACGLVFGACGAKPQLTPENLDKVKDGMTTAQVKAVLGEPTAVKTVTLPMLGTVTTYEYKTDKADVDLHFRDDQLRVKIGSVQP
jgi:hypothetical protein